jgi:hypothetical protein
MDLSFQFTDDKTGLKKLTKTLMRATSMNGSFKQNGARWDHERSCEI